MIAKLARQTIGTSLFLVMGVAVIAETAAATEFYLVAGETTKVMLNGQSIPMWGFALDPDHHGGDGIPTVPGPELLVPPGNAGLTIHVKNNLPAPVSIVIPGQMTTMSPVKFTDGQGRQRVRSFAHQTAPASSGTYTWPSLRAGTYLYESGTHPAVQVQMGLYGCVKGMANGNRAYPGISYDSEAVVFYSEIDPALHEAVQNGTYGTPPMTSTIDYKPQFFLINGNPYTGVILPLSAATAGDQVLIRFLNAGLKTHAPVLLGKYMSVIAEDGRPYSYSKEQYSLTLPAGQTKDAIVVNSAGRFPLYDRTIVAQNNDPDNDGILSDGDGSGVAGDNPCTGGNTADCDDNCPNTPNPDQLDTNGNGTGDACEFYTLTLTVRNGVLGSVTVDPNLPQYPAGSVVVLTAAPAEGMAFEQWTIFDPNYPGDADYAAVDTNSVLRLAMIHDSEVEAWFRCGSSVMLPPIGMVLLLLALGVVVRRLT